MCQDLAEYDPFAPLYVMGDGYYEVSLYDEPMEKYNWKEFLEADDYF